MSLQLTGGTIAPWILGGLALLVLLSIALMVNAWRDAKRSPYFFLRRQAQQRMQDYALLSLVLLAATLITSGYASRAPEPDYIRSALIVNAKPPVDEAASDRVAVVAEPQVVDIGSAGGSLARVDLAGDPSTAAGATTSGALAAPAELLPEVYNRITGEVERTEATTLSPLTFSKTVSDNYRPLSPARLFSEGFYTIYATFDYEGMTDGMAWSWVWRYEGEVIGGGNELWAYGDDGPGYVYLRPETGFAAGQYSVEVWINGEMIVNGNLIVTGGAVSSSN